MSLLPKGQLFQKVLSAIQASGVDAKVISGNHPFQLLLSYDGITEFVRVYIWNVTHGGGRARAADEYRIQITGVNRIRTGTNFRTLLLGWDERHQVFVGYNAGRYETFGSSPSLQVRDGTLSSAARQGLAVQQKEFDSKIAHQQNEIEALTAGLQKVSAQLETSKPSKQMFTNNQ